MQHRSSQRLLEYHRNGRMSLRPSRRHDNRHQFPADQMLCRGAREHEGDVWEICLRRTRDHGVELHSAGYITSDDLDGLEPFLFIGLPAVAVLRLILRSEKKEGLFFSDQMQVTHHNRPHNAFADNIWHSAMKTKRLAAQASPILDSEMDFLIYSALQRPETEPPSEGISSLRRSELKKVVSAAIGLAINASRSASFKESIGSVLQDVLLQSRGEMPR
ncbi:unnamed protein product [Effrenium voratum]|nr:unnamed protein product [Effrenium voratum]